MSLYRDFFTDVHIYYYMPFTDDIWSKLPTKNLFINIYVEETKNVKATVDKREFFIFWI